MCPGERKCRWKSFASDLTPCSRALEDSESPCYWTLTPPLGPQAFLGLYGELGHLAQLGCSGLLRRKTVRGSCRKEKKKHVSSAGRCYYRPTTVSERLSSTQGLRGPCGTKSRPSWTHQGLFYVDFSSSLPPQPRPPCLGHLLTLFLSPCSCLRFTTSCLRHCNSFLMCLLALQSTTSPPNSPACLPGLAVPVDRGGRREQERVWKTGLVLPTAPISRQPKEGEREKWKITIDPKAGSPVFA